MTASVIAAAFVSAALLSGVVRRYAIGAGILALQTRRSSHVGAVPKGGGLGVIAAILVGLAVAAGQGLSIPSDVRLALVGLLLIGAVGWRDDRVGLGVPVRLAVHFLGALSVLPLVLAPTAIPVWMGPAAAAWWLIWAVSAINVVNFMDGIDGLIGSQALIFGTHLTVLGPAGALSEVLGWVVVGASVGFLFWNWAPAKIFLGDVGSGSLGLIMVLGGALAMREGDVGLAAAFLPLYPIFLDATSTLLLRAVRGERIVEAHRSHLYQILANGGWGHSRVSLLYASVGIAGAAVAAGHDAEGWWGMVAVYLVVVFVSGALLRRWSGAVDKGA